MSIRIIMLNQNMLEKAKLCYMDTGSFIVYIKTNDIYLQEMLKLDLMLHNKIT